MALSKIKSDSIDSIDAAKVPNLDASKIATGTVDNARITLDAAEIPDLDAAKITTGDIALARLGNAPATDLTPVRQDIAMLALYNAVSDNRAAYNLPSSFIDQFEDDTGTTTRTDVSNVDEYFASVYSAETAFTSDANTRLLLHFDGVNDGTTFTDSGPDTHTVTRNGDPVTNTGSYKRMGTAAGDFDGAGDYLSVPSHANLNIPDQGAMTAEAWVYRTADTTANHTHIWQSGAWGANNFSLDFYPSNSGSFPNWLRFSIKNNSGTEYELYGGTPITTGGWFHVAVTRTAGSAGEIKFWVNGTLDATRTNTNYSHALNTSGGLIGTASWHTAAYFTGYMDEFRFSNVQRYTTNFTPNAGSAANATGTLISDQQTAPALTKMSGVVLVKDGGSSTTVMGTHLKIYFCATGTAASFPSAWVEADSYTAVTAPFSTGVTMYKLGETTVPSGTNPTIRAVWASQTSGGFESQLHGWAMNY